MGLILCVKKGKPFFIGNQAVVIQDIVTTTYFMISVGKKIHTITKNESVEILPNVMASCGGTCPKDFVKILLEAPREIIIARERIYRQRKYAELHPRE